MIKLTKGQAIQFTQEGHPLYGFNPGDQGQFIEKHFHSDGSDTGMAMVSFEGENILVPEGTFKTDSAMKTCGNCPHLRVVGTKRFRVAICGDADLGLVVPHSWQGGTTMTFTRVPSYCKNPKALKVTGDVPEGEWITRKIEEIKELDHD